MTPRRLSKRERQERIIAALRVNSTVRVAALAETFGVATETVRRDLDDLSRRGLVDRAYGGAAARPMAREPAFVERERALRDERGRIGALAATLVVPGEVVMIDAGSTTTCFAHALAAADIELAVLTNSYSVATALAPASRARVVLCPGDYEPREAGVYGPEAIAFLERFHANTAFIGGGGVTAEGVTDADSRASWVKRMMLRRAERGLLLADHSKFGTALLEVVCPLAALDDLVTDAAPPADLGEALADAGVAVHVAE